MTGQELQTAAAFFSILKTLAGNDFFLVIACLTIAAVVIVPSVFAFKSVKALSLQIVPLRDEISRSRDAFTKLIGEINSQREISQRIISDHRQQSENVLGLVERTAKALVKLEKTLDKELV